MSPKKYDPSSPLRSRYSLPEGALFPLGEVTIHPLILGLLESRGLTRDDLKGFLTAHQEGTWVSRDVFDHGPKRYWSDWAKGQTKILSDQKRGVIGSYHFIPGTQEPFLLLILTTIGIPREEGTWFLIRDHQFPEEEPDQYNPDQYQVLFPSDITPTRMDESPDHEEEI